MPLPRIALLLKRIYDVAGHVALVTDGGTGIGLKIARGFAVNSAKVYIGSRRGEKVEVTAKENSPASSEQIVAIELDVSDKGSIKNAVKAVSDNDGKLNILVNNTAITGPVSMFVSDDSAPEDNKLETLDKVLFGNESFEEWGGLYANNVASLFFVAPASLGLLHKASDQRGAWSANVINVSSISGQLKISENMAGFRHSIHYLVWLIHSGTKFCCNSGKTANIHLTMMFTTEFTLKNIPVRANSIAPGPSELLQVVILANLLF